MSVIFPQWIDHGVQPHQLVPMGAVAAGYYLAQCLGHPVYERWTWQQLLKVYAALPDARRAKPKVCLLLIEHTAVIEFWQRGRVHAVAESEAPNADMIVGALLKSRKRRFKPVGVVDLTSREDSADQALTADRGIPIHLVPWLQRTGRLFNPQTTTNTLGVSSDLDALSAFLHERASHSRHTWRRSRSWLRENSYSCALCSRRNSTGVTH